MTRILYGVPTYSLEEILNNFMVQQGNNRRSHYADYMITAQQVWQQLFRETIWEVRQIVLDVDKENHTITLPAGMDRFISISVVDYHGNMQPITYDPNLNTLVVKCHQRKCSCQTCQGQDSMCDAIDSITMRQYPVIINTITYYQRVWNKKCDTGILEISETPYQDGTEITYRTSEKLICEMEMDEKGCILPTAPNRELFEHHFGCFLLDCFKKVCHDWHHRERVSIPPDFSFYGFYKPDATCDNVIHLKHVKADKVIVSYQPAPNFVDSEVMVPQYAQEAMMYGLHHFTTRFRNNISVGEKREAQLNFKKAQTALFGFMYPINLAEFIKLPARKRLW